MNITINGLKLGEDTKFLLQSPISGLSKAPIRTADGDYSGRDGGYVSAQLYGKRLVSLQGWVYGSSCEDNELLRGLLMEALEIRKLLPVYIRTFAGDYYLMMAYVTDLKMDITSQRVSAYKIDLLAPDPYLYDVGDGEDPDSGWIQQTISKAVGGGYVFPYVLPVNWQAGISNSIVTNLGDSMVYPQIVLTDKWTNPTITNITTGQHVTLNMTTSVGDVLIIDMDRRTITLNGGSVIANRTTDSFWWGLLVGDNAIELTSTSGTDNNTAVVRWRTRYSGI